MKHVLLVGSDAVGDVAVLWDGGGFRIDVYKYTFQDGEVFLFRLEKSLQEMLDQWRSTGRWVEL